MQQRLQDVPVPLMTQDYWMTCPLPPPENAFANSSVQTRLPGMWGSSRGSRLAETVPLPTGESPYFSRACIRYV